MSEVQLISNLNNRNSIFYGYVLGVQKENPKKTVKDIALEYATEIDDTVEIETLIRRYNDVKSTIIRFKLNLK